MPNVVSLSDVKLSLLEKYLSGNLELQPKTPQTISRRDPNEVIPLSYAQEQVWLHAQLAPDLPLYNEPVTIHHNGPLDVAVLERSFNEILRRHEAWRTSFSIVDGRPVQVVHPDLSVSFTVTDLRGFPEERRETEALRIATSDTMTPLDLTRAPCSEPSSSGSATKNTGST